MQEHPPLGMSWVRILPRAENFYSERSYPGLVELFVVFSITSLYMNTCTCIYMYLLFFQTAEFVQTHQKANGGSLSLVVSIGSGIYPPEPIGNTDIFVGKTWYQTPSKLKNDSYSLPNLRKSITPLSLIHPQKKRMRVK